ncbi:SNF2 family N-terminal domain-containing protein [Biscogniauxia marginata]|nr:SNF2 family N-terminal domain-containing protein [Biscogniauxia marginata]
MEEQWIHQRYIPAGCLTITAEKTNLAPELSVLSELSGWKHFTRRHDKAPISSLPHTTQQALLALPVLKPFASIWQNRWIQLSITTITPSDSQIVGRVRVYILPQDVNRSVQALQGELNKILSLLLSQLDYSREAWDGESSSPHQGRLTPQGVDAPSEKLDTSLLTMFNNVPSPDPHPETVVDQYDREAMQCLLESQIPGLLTPLYPYQSRSAALMLQREVDPGRTIDPRLRCVTDQAGSPWYCDSVSGIVLKEPRYYDGPRGGILAEEMGTGKTLICLALILITKDEPTRAPEPFVAETPPRSQKASLMDMAAAAANKHSIPWKPYFEDRAREGYYYQNCIRALTRSENRAIYKKFRNTLVEPRRSSRTAPLVSPLKQVYLSCTTLVIVPNNLVKQWQNEIKKHTTGLTVLVLVEKNPIPPVTELLTYDVILFSEGRFEWIQKELFLPNREMAIDIYCPLHYIHFKRCIIDEGHKLGNGSRAWKNDVMRVLDRLEISARWVVTGTPSRGLFGVQQTTGATGFVNQDGNQRLTNSKRRQERGDIQRIGNLTSKYLKVRPWANTKDEAGDTVAEWNAYVIYPKQYSNGHNRKDCLITTLNSLIIRHRLSDVSTLLPPVDEKVVVLDGSFQDRLSLNLFSMMIIFNSVQSQRTDQDYFFHERQRKSLLQLVKNLKQASFFGGVFYSTKDIAKALETAEDFLQKKEIPISAEDEDLLRKAIDFGKLAIRNRLKDVSNQFHAMPLYVKDFPGGNGKNWSLDNRESQGEPVCTDAGLIHSLQKLLNPCIDAPTSLQLMIDSGRLDQQGRAERAQALSAAMDASGESASRSSQATSLAGNTPLGDDHHTKPKSGILKNSDPIVIDDDQSKPGLATDIEIAEPLAKTQIISTVSAKLSYLIDSVVKYQDEEQIIIFYENENIAYYLASVLEILQIQHLIYARSGLSAERRAQYVATFTHNPKFRVLLMDISQAAFGLDMRSASRIYFISPVLNPQVEAQAIGRARRISQKKPVSVETLVLRNSIEEVIVDRRKHMTQAEHSRVKTVLDDRQMYEWILNARIIPMSADADAGDGVAQTAMLRVPQFIFGRGFGRELHPDEGLVVTGGSPEKTPTTAKTTTNPEREKHVRVPFKINNNDDNNNNNRDLKRPQSPSPAAGTAAGLTDVAPERSGKRRARIAWAE